MEDHQNEVAFRFPGLLVMDMVDLLVEDPQEGQGVVLGEEDLEVGDHVVVLEVDLAGVVLEEDGVDMVALEEDVVGMVVLVEEVEVGVALDVEEGSTEVGVAMVGTHEMSLYCTKQELVLMDYPEDITSANKTFCQISLLILLLPLQYSCKELLHVASINWT